MIGKKYSLEQAISIWGVVTLSIVSISSAPQLIDGISYHKVALALTLMSVIMPFILNRIIFQEKSYILPSLVGMFIAIAVTALLDGQNNYRDLFGAPGRSNGIISFINFAYFILFGFYLARASKLSYLIKGLTGASSLVCLSIILMTQLDLFQNSFLAAWNFKNTSFQENSNLIAPLIAMGFVNTIQQIVSKFNLTNLMLLLPQLYLLVKLGLLQSLLVVAVGLTVYLFVRKFPSIKPKWFPLGITTLYLIGVWITKSQNFLRDTSLIERRKILSIFGELREELTFLPKHIDALSDFTGGYGSPQILDDFHNVFLQVIFSYGILIGIAFLFLSLLPFFILNSNSTARNAILPIYTTFFTSLIVGIISPNYMYFGSTFIGAAISARISNKKIKVTRLDRTERLVSLLLTGVVIIILSVQSKDYLLRREISHLTQRGSVSPIDLTLLSQRTIELPDAGYRYLVSRNLYIVGECANGDAILEAMAKTNRMEVRILRLKEFNQKCEK